MVPKISELTKSDGRCVSYIEGDVPAELDFHNDGVLRASAKPIRRFPDIGAEQFRCRQASWRLPQSAVALRFRVQGLNFCRDD